MDELTIIGYGFGDRHINFRLSNAMSLNERLRLRIVYPWFQPIPECVRHFDYDGRVRQLPVALRSGCPTPRAKSGYPADAGA